MKSLTEQIARELDASFELDCICENWIRGASIDKPRTSPRLYSKKWEHAGPLLEAMGCPELMFYTHRVEVIVFLADGDIIKVSSPKDQPELAIARACAILAARGISRAEHNDC